MKCPLLVYCLKEFIIIIFANMIRFINYKYLNELQCMFNLLNICVIIMYTDEEKTQEKKYGKTTLGDASCSVYFEW